MRAKPIRPRTPSTTPRRQPPHRCAKTHAETSASFVAPESARFTPSRTTDAPRVPVRCRSGQTNHICLKNTSPQVPPTSGIGVDTPRQGGCASTDLLQQSLVNRKGHVFRGPEAHNTWAHVNRETGITERSTISLNGGTHLRDFSFRQFMPSVRLRRGGRPASVHPVRALLCTHPLQVPAFQPERPAACLCLTIARRQARWHQGRCACRVFLTSAMTRSMSAIVMRSRPFRSDSLCSSVTARTERARRMSARLCSKSRPPQRSGSPRDARYW